MMEERKRTDTNTPHVRAPLVSARCPPAGEKRGRAAGGGRRREAAQREEEAAAAARGTYFFTRPDMVFGVVVGRVPQERTELEARIAQQCSAVRSFPGKETLTWRGTTPLKFPLFLK